MSNPHPPPASGDMPLGSEFLRRLSADEEAAWQVLLRRLLPRARELIERCLATDTPPHSDGPAPAN
jgi:hypothetical protein